MKKKINTKFNFIKFNLFLASILFILSFKNDMEHANNIKNNIKNFEDNNNDFIGLYDEYLSILAIYYSNLDLDNVFNKFSFMLKNGYISYGAEFEKMDPELDAYKYGGIDVINGRGVCRNINCCFTDLLKKMGYDAGNIYGILEFENDVSLKPNHVITWVKFDNEIYLYDVANNIKYDKILDVYYNKDKKLLFIPSRIMTKRFGSELCLDIIPYKSSNDEIIKIHYNCVENGSECFNFEKENLLDIEKEVYIKIKCLQNN